MGAIIRASSASLDSNIYSSITHAAIAGKECLHSANISAEDVGLLFNVGIYRDSNMMEPAMAALIQKELGMNLDYIKSLHKKTAASFDLMNGVCGVLNATQVASAFLATQSTKFALVVSSDAHPSMKLAKNFPYANIGAAMLLEWSEQSSRGFGKFQFRTSKDAFLGLKSYINFDNPNARENIEIEQHPDYEKRLLEFLSQSILEYIASENIALDDTLFITSQLNSEFYHALAKKLNVSEDAIIKVKNTEKDPHSSAMILGYFQAMLEEKNKKYKQILFAAGGAGLTSACVIYRR